MNCPFHIQIYKSELRSYRELPMRLAEFGTVCRYEQSGELGGLTRVRGFTVDDSHLFVTPEQLDGEFLNVVDLILTVFRSLQLKNFKARLSFRDPTSDKYIGGDEVWDTDKKTALNIENLGTVETTVEKDALSLTYNTNTSENYRTIQSGKEVIVNINTNNMNTWSFTK